MFCVFSCAIAGDIGFNSVKRCRSRSFAANFWTTQGVSNGKKDQQRDVLRVVENARNENHASQQAQPIRYCYVAWSIVKLDGNILFYQREDTQKRFDKSAGDYGLIYKHLKISLRTDFQVGIIPDGYPRNLGREPVRTFLLYTE